MAQNFSAYVQFRLKPEDAIALDRAAQSQSATRSEVLRSLIRSLNKSNPAIEKAAS